MTLPKENIIVLPHIKHYQIIAISDELKLERNLSFRIDIKHHQLGRVGHFSEIDKVFDALSKHIDSEGSDWQFYVIPELVRPYSFAAALRLHRSYNHELNSTHPDNFLTFLKEKNEEYCLEREGCSTKDKEQIINMLKLFNLLRNNADFATKSISARKDELTSKLSISQRALTKSLHNFVELGLIKIETGRRHKDTSLPDLILLSDVFFQIAFTLTGQELISSFKSSLKKINTNGKTNFSANGTYLTLFDEVEKLVTEAKSILIHFDGIISQDASSTELPYLQSLKRAIQEAKQSIISEEKKQADKHSAENELKCVDSDYGQSIFQKVLDCSESLLIALKKLNQGPYDNSAKYKVSVATQSIDHLQAYLIEVQKQQVNLIDFAKAHNHIYTTSDEALVGYKELEIHVIECKKAAKKLFLSGLIQNPMATTSLSYLL
jgi:hypothetical protein